MNQIFTLGETVYDIMFTGGQPEAGRPGGAMLNTAVTLGRLRLKPQLISEIGTDETGSLVSRFLEENGVLTDHCYLFSDGQTPVAMAFLDEHRNASYAFYRNFPMERLKIPGPDFSPGDMLMFGSYFSISKELRPAVSSILEKARQAGALLFYDPNFRKAHHHELPELTGPVKENLHMAHIVRGSDEDFNALFGCSNAAEAHRHCPRSTLFYTMGSKGCTMITPDGSTRHWDTESIEPVSTIGAGDTFNAGLAYGIWHEKLTFDTLHNPHASCWEPIVKRALRFSAAVCMSFDNYISQSMADQIHDGTEN